MPTAATPVEPGRLDVLGALDEVAGLERAQISQRWRVLALRLPPITRISLDLGVLRRARAASWFSLVA